MDNIQQMYFNAGAPVAAATTTSNVPPPPPPPQRKRKQQHITDDDNVEVIALSADKIKATNLFLCDLCNKGFIREQNLQLHQRAHDLPYVYRKRSLNNIDDEKRKVYVCPETTCAHHDSSKALCDLPSLRKHFRRKHGEKTMHCNTCNRKYAVEGDLRAHLRICGTKKYKCDCGNSFSRKNNYMTHRISCDAVLAKYVTSLQNELQTIQTTVRDNSISFLNKEPVLISSDTPTSANSFSLLNNTMVASSVPNLSSSNQFVPQNMTTIEFSSSRCVQDDKLIDNIYDFDVMNDELFDVSSVHATALPHEASQQGITLIDSGSSTSLGYLEDFIVADFDSSILNRYTNVSNASSENSHFSRLENLTSTYENPDQSKHQENGISGNILNLQGDYENVAVANENICSTIIEDKTTKIDDLLGFGVDQINREEHLSGHRIDMDANFPELQDDLNFWENWGK